MQKQMHVKCFDAGEAVADRYTVLYLRADWRATEHGTSAAVIQFRGMSERPCHPQGVGQMGELRMRPGEDFAHLGKQVRFRDLPPEVQALVRSDHRWAEAQA